MTSASRNHSIDAFRVYAAWAVICVHTDPFTGPAFGPHVRLLGELLNQFVRVAVPFFFLASGYFYSVGLSRGEAPMPLAARLIRRLVRFFAFWSIIYLLLPLDVFLRAPEAGYWHAVRIMIWHSYLSNPILEGTKEHLWFLPALICALALLATACRLRLERSLWVFAIALYLFGLVAGAYKATPIGLDLGINTRDGPFFSTLFVVSGFLFHRLNLHFTLRQGIILVVFGLALRILELLWLTGKYGMAPSNIDFMLGTYPFGIGIFALLMTTKSLGDIKWMVRLSRYSAGVYCAHMLAVDVLQIRVPAHGMPLWEIARPFLALALTFALVMSMAKVPLLKPVVT